MAAPCCGPSSPRRTAGGRWPREGPTSPRRTRTTSSAPRRRRRPGSTAGPAHGSPPPRWRRSSARARCVRSGSWSGTAAASGVVASCASVSSGTTAPSRSPATSCASRSDYAATGSTLSSRTPSMRSTPRSVGRPGSWGRRWRRRLTRWVGASGVTRRARSTGRPRPALMRCTAGSWAAGRG